MGCGSGAAGTGEWFDTCRHGDPSSGMCAQYALSRDSGPYSVELANLSFNNDGDQLTSYRYPYVLRLPGFTGLMYAVIYNRPSVVRKLLDLELCCATDQGVWIPLQQENIFGMALVTDPVVETQFASLGIKHYATVPRNSTALDLSIILGRFGILQIILEYVERLPMAQQDAVLQHINQQFQSNLMLLCRVDPVFSMQIMDRFGRLLIDTQFEFENIMGENASWLAAVEGNYQLLQYFFGLANDPQYYKSIELQLEQKQFGRDLLQLFQENKQKPQFQKCIKLYQQFLQHKFPPAPAWLQEAQNALRPAILEEEMQFEELDQLEVTKKDPAAEKRFTKSIFEEDAVNNERAIQQIVAKMQSQLKTSLSGLRTDSEIQRADPSPSKDMIEDQEQELKRIDSRIHQKLLEAATGNNSAVIAGEESEQIITRRPSVNSVMHQSGSKSNPSGKIVNEDGEELLFCIQVGETKTSSTRSKVHISGGRISSSQQNNVSTSTEVIRLSGTTGTSTSRGSKGYSKTQ